MVFLHDRSLEEAMKIFAGDPQLSWAQFSLHDWASDAPIMGMHIWRNNVTWNIDRDNVFPDVSPKTLGHSKNIRSFPAPIAIHIPEPRGLQAFHSVFTARSNQPERFRPPSNSLLVASTGEGCALFGTNSPETPTFRAVVF